MYKLNYIIILDSTRKHSSRMRTDCSISGGGLHPPGADPLPLLGQAPPLEQAPPPWEQTPQARPLNFPLGQTPPLARPLNSPPPETCCKACWDTTQPPVERHTRVKT